MPSRIFQCALLSASIPFAQALSAQLAAPVPHVPKALEAPSGQVVVRSLDGKGSQIYVCQNAGGAYAWKLKGPDAKLFGENGESVGRHFAGPTWKANDGSFVTGKLVASVPSPDTNSIPWLLLTITSHGGEGIMTRVETIERLNTKGGVAPASGCSAMNKGQEVPVPYEASYYFYGVPSPARH